MRNLSHFLWSIFVVVLLFLLDVDTFAVELVEATNIKDNVGGIYKVGALEEGGKFYHDRQYTITRIPKEFLGLTHILVSADCPGGQKWKLTFMCVYDMLLTICINYFLPPMEIRNIFILEP